MTSDRRYLPPLPPTLPISQPPPPAGTRVLIAWILILISASFFIYRAAAFREEAQNSEHGGDLQLELASRYVLGCKLLFGHTTAMPQASLDNLAATVRASAKTPLDHLRVVPVIAELQGHQTAAREAAEFLRQSPPDDLIGDAESLEQAYLGKTPGPDAGERQRLLDEFGWYGQLAVSQFPESDPSIRADVESAAKRTVIACIIAAAFGVIFLLIGIVLAIVLLIQWLSGNLPLKYSPADPAVCDAMVEGFAVYLFMMMAIWLCELFLPKHPGFGWNALLVAPVIAAIWWVRRRGVSGPQLAAAVGLNRGNGIVWEMFSGIVGYIAGLPLLAMGFLCFILLSKLTPTKATHPIAKEILAGGWMRVALIFLACVFAPFAEELLFRGMLLRHLTLRRSWFLSAIIVSIIFAAIHPQGWTAIPLLGSVGLVLALIRIQRNNLVASMTAHALNNFLVIMLLISAAG